MSKSPVLSSSGEAIRDTFRAWHTERESLDAQLGESLAALAAYQSHLDAWQQQLARERGELLAVQLDSEHGCEQLQAARALVERDRDELHAARNQFDLDQDVLRAAHAEMDRDRDELRGAREQMDRERDELRAAKGQLEGDWDELRGARGKIEQERDELRAARNQVESDRVAADRGQFEASATVTAELNAARDKIGALTTSLLGRTDELRTLDNRRAEVVTELELARAREKELKAALEEQKRTAEQERAHWTEELRHLRELLARQLDATDMEDRAMTVDQAATVAAPAASTSVGAQVGARVIPRENPVLGSIVEQFGKLRQQKAFDRQAANRPR